MSFIEPKIRLGNKTYNQTEVQEVRKRNSKRYNAQVRNKVDRAYTELYKSPKWRRVKKLAKMRDNYLCQHCLKKGIVNDKNLIVHHIVEVKINWDKRFDLSNLETVCASCHNRIEHNPRRGN